MIFKSYFNKSKGLHFTLRASEIQNKQESELVNKMNTSLNERIPESLRRNATVVLNINSLKYSVKLELLIIHVSTKLVIIDTPVSVRIANPEQLLGVFVHARDLKGDQSFLDLGAI